MWNVQMQVDIVDIMDQSITCSVNSDSHKFVFSIIYGVNEGVERRKLWQHLIALQGVVSQKPWILAGDWNVMAHPSKSSKFDGSQVPNLDMKEFTECLEHLAVFDHNFTGLLFTWSNKQGEGFMARKLDRVLVNSVWLQAYESSKVEFLSSGESDHCLALVQLSQVVNSPPKPFKFFNF